ncbi:MAG: hypothetical protein Aurels2KO_19420 [Aureliella sp.]
MKVSRFYTKFLCFTLAFPIISTAIRAQEIGTRTGNYREIIELVGYEYQFPAMGTLVQLKAYSSDASRTEQLFKRAEQRVQEVAATLTDYDAASETRQLTTQALGKHTSVSEDLWNVLVASEMWFERSEGAFDSSLGQVTVLWRKYRRASRSSDRAAAGPPKQDIQAALTKTGWNKVKLDHTKQTICINKTDVRLDFGGIGKGYAVDAAYDVLIDGGLDCCLVNISGNMRMGRSPPGRDGWRLEIAPLSKGGPPLRRIEVAHCAIATSGDLWQFTLINGVRRSHILDPQTGVGVPGPIAATAIATTATDADALATVATVLQAEKLRSLHGELADCSIIVARSGDESTKAEPSKPRVKVYGDFPSDTRNVAAPKQR